MAIEVRMMLFDKNPVRRTDLFQGAATIKAQPGVVCHGIVRQDVRLGSPGLQVR